VYCIRGTELRNWKTERARTAAHRKIKKRSLEKRQLAEGDLILEVSGGGPEQPVGRVERIDRSVLSQNSEYPKVCTNFFRKLEVTEHVSSEYLAKYLKYFYQTPEINRLQGGSNNLRNLKYPKYEKLRVLLPPLNEQHQIVEKIDELFAELDQGEAALEHTLTLLERYRQSLLKAAVTGELTADWRKQNAANTETGQQLLDRILQTRREHWESEPLARREAKGKSPRTDSWKKQHKEPAAPDTTNLPELPAGGAWASVDQVSDVIGGLPKTSKRNELPLRRPMPRVAN